MNVVFSSPTAVASAHRDVRPPEWVENGEAAVLMAGWTAAEGARARSAHGFTAELARPIAFLAVART